MTKQTLYLTILAIALLLASACTTTKTSSEMARQLVPVIVDNDLVNRSDVTVRMMASDGSSSLLGGASPGSTGEYTFSDRVFAGQYHLEAETGDGRTIRSRDFTLFPGAAVLWELNRNDLQVVSAATIEDPGGEGTGR